MFAMTMLWLVFLQHLTRLADGIRLSVNDTPLIAVKEEDTAVRRVPAQRTAPSTA